MAFEPELGRAVLELATDHQGFFSNVDKAEKKAIGLRGAFADAGSRATRFGSEMTSAGKTASTAMDGVAGSARKVGAAIVAGLSVAAIGGVVKQYVEFAGKIQDLSAKAGMSVESFQKLSYAIRLNGGSMEDVAQGATLLGKNLTTGTKQVTTAVSELGLDIRKLRTMDPADAFIAIGDAVARIPNPLKQSQLAMALFGEMGAKYLPAFKGNLSATAAEAERLGLVLSQDAIDAADEFGDTMDKLKMVGMAVVSQALTPMLPALTEILTSFSALASKILPQVVAGMSDVVTTGKTVVTEVYDKWKKLPDPVRDTAVAVGEVTAAVWLLHRALGAVSATSLIKGLVSGARYLGEMVRLVQYAGWGGIGLIFRNWGASATGLLGPLTGIVGPLAAIVGSLATMRGLAGSWEGAFQDMFRVLTGRDPINTRMNLSGLGPDAARAMAALQALTDQGLKPVASHGAAAAPAIRELSDSQKKLLEQYTGQGLLTKARDYAVVLRTIGGASKLTAAEQEEFRKVFAAVIEKYQRLGPAGAPIVAHFEALGRTIPLASTSLAGYLQQLPQVENQTIRVGRALAGLAEDGTLAVTQSFGDFVGLAPVVASRSREIGEALDAASESTIDWKGTLGELSQAFANLAQISNGSLSSVFRGVGSVIASMNLLATGFETFKKGQAAMDAATTSAQRLAAGMQQVAGGLSVAASMFQIVLSVQSYFDNKQRQINATIEQTRLAIRALVSGNGGLEGLQHNLQLTGVEWAAWAEFLEKNKTNATAVANGIDAINRALENLKKRQEAATTAVELTAELVGNWITPLRELKEKIQEAQDAFDTKKVEEFKRQLAALAPAARESFKSLTAYAVGSFAAVFRTTGDFYGALQSVGSILDELIEGERILGEAAEGAIGELLEIRKVQKEYKDLLDPLNLATRIVQNLETAGIHSSDAYEALARDAKQTFNAMIAGGKDAKIVMALMQPTLQTLWRQWKDGKIAVDEETEAILRQAEEHGIVGENQKSINEKMLDAFADLKQAIEDMTKAITDWGDAAAEGFRKATEGAITYGKAVPRGTPPVPGSATDGDGDQDGDGGSDAPPRTPTPRPRPPGEVHPTVMHVGGTISRPHGGATRWALGGAMAKAHSGMYVGRAALAADEVPIIAQTGEEVIDRPTAALARWAVGQLGTGGSGVDAGRLADAIVSGLARSGVGRSGNVTAHFNAFGDERWIREQFLPQLLTVWRRGGAALTDTRVALRIE